MILFSVIERTKLTLIHLWKLIGSKIVLLCSQVQTETVPKGVTFTGAIVMALLNREWGN